MFLIVFAVAMSCLAVMAFACADGRMPLLRLPKLWAWLLCAVFFLGSALAWAQVYGWEWGIPFLLAVAMIAGIAYALLINFFTSLLKPVAVSVTAVALLSLLGVAL